MLPRAFYVRSTVEVAKSVLGATLIHGDTAGRIIEVEAYLGQHDLAAHASHGKTPRTAVLFGPPGHAYVYFIYGMHRCLNLVAEPDGTPGCVLIRGLEPLAGLKVMKTRRQAATKPADLCSGPGNLTRALDIRLQHYGADLTRGPITLHEPVEPPAGDILVTPRIGIRHCADWPLRFVLR